MIIKNYCVDYSKQKTTNNRKRIHLIETQLKSIELAHHSEINIIHKRKLEKELDDHYKEKCKGAYIRSRANWIENGEKNTSYFLSLEKKQQFNNAINRIKDENNVIYTDNENIMKCIHKFYSSLYTSKNVSDLEIEKYLNDINCEKITQSEMEMCDELPKLDECKEAIKLMKNNKSPGQDGLPVEFYKIFWNDIKEIYYASLIKSIEQDILPFSQRSAIMSLIYKKGEKENISNYRPISLTNVDYKIFAHVLAKRLQRVCNRIIGKEQSAYIKGRYIGVNARLILDIFEYYNNNDLDGILLFLDFEKAFDSVEYNFMYKALEKFNFGKNFIKMVKILYNKPLFKIKNNGWISRSCEMHRGVRQGCPVSALLFILVIEILSVKIRKSDDIKGLTFNDNTDNIIKIVQHADDCTNMLKDTNSLKKTLETINEFSNKAGTKLNLDKTECLLTGSFLSTYSRENSIHGVKIAKKYVKSLGVYLGHDEKECYDKNWISKLEKLERTLSVWRKRNLTIYGKSMVINTLAISKLVYNALILPNPENTFFKEATKIIFNFLWRKKDRIKRNTLIGKIEEGGIGIVDIESKFLAAKASWVARIVDNKSTIHRYLSDILVKCNLSIYDILKTSNYNTEKSDFFKILKLPQFYLEVFNALNKSKKTKQFNLLKRDEFLSEFIWDNNLFQYKSKPLCFENWIKSGILYVKDIFDEQGSLYDINYFSRVLNKKNNILCEYIILRSCFKKYIDKFDCTFAKYINVQNNTRITFRDGSSKNVDRLKSDCYYSIFLNMKFQRSIYENKWEKLFGISSRINWKNIYCNKIKCMHDKKVAEFNYKLVNCILNNNLSVSKWNKDVSPVCEYCQTTEDCKHLLFDCEMTKFIWEKVERFFAFNINWKSLVLGFYHERNSKTKQLNNIISTVCYSIYRYKMSCRIKQEKLSQEHLRYFVKSSLSIENCVLKKAGCITDNMYCNLSESI
jgi:hypothetical protein